jgi:tetratricopeptide (TPR) repeat protein
MLATCLDRFDEAERHYQAALEMEDRIASPPLLARTRYWYARMLLERQAPGDRERAVELLVLALETADALGMRALAAEIKDLAATRAPTA